MLSRFAKTLAVCAAAAAKPACGGFLDDGCGDTGKPVNFHADGTVTSFCYNKICDGWQPAMTAINLDDCVTNSNGQLKAKPESVERGLFMQTCQNCTSRGSEVQCRCRDVLGQYRETSLDLNFVLTNWYGYLECSGVISKSEA
ncbi:Cyanovirin-N-like protein [Colletotrichum orbiculare MAFF 240422]|uniref:Cyanovirin-N-like protein n=1 Tax=Colletotrichum orbiculare (strain 104-T / ATCC 96160 / CBS 514.97 / LARS 414 / MAFF 240422) TaxID=1213857 RepID=A0A484FNL1_COLOR|nr:Cyanovirin-N-like protein [Colletotrichum orbiculare MAFF 240422]